jgi:hypothetical protein
VGSWYWHHPSDGPNIRSKDSETGYPIPAGDQRGLTKHQGRVAVLLSPDVNNGAKTRNFLKWQLRNSLYTLLASCESANMSRVSCQLSGWRRWSGKRRAAGCQDAETWWRRWCRKGRAAKNCNGNYRSAITG